MKTWGKYEVIWLRLKNGKEADETTGKVHFFDTLEKAKEFLTKRSEKISPMYWAGGTIIETDTQNIIFGICSDYTNLMEETQ